jgi:cell cycle sensor histidine kinase DivJ
MAALALGPAAAMATLGSPRPLALAAALTAATVAAVALASAAGLIAPVASSGPWAALAALSLTGLGLAAALEMARAQTGEREGAQAETAMRLAGLLEASPTLVLRLDRAGVVREYFGGPPDLLRLTLVGRPFEQLAGDRSAARAALALAARSGEASVGFAPPMAPDRFLAVELRALGGGEVMALVRDASRERAYEAFLEHAKAEAENMAHAKARFLANMSHELRTPLNAIIGFSDIMRSKMFGPLAERYAEYAALIHESGGHLLDLINDVLDMSKIEADRFELNLESFDAREAVSSALRLTRVQADTAGVQLRGVLPAEPIAVSADRRALKQIALNLISNALKFTPAGGEVNVVARASGTDLEVIVADTGVGIAPADLERLGRPFEQAGEAGQRVKGTGLGLSLVRAFAELHGGSMAIMSALGEGAVFTVRLPVLTVAPQAERESTEAAAAPVEAPADPIEPADNVIRFKPGR